MSCASELKPYFHNNEDPWKKNWHFKYWNWPRCNQNSQILAKKSISQYGYLKHSKWAVLRNLSIISIIMRIGEKKLGCLNTKNLWLATMLLFFICVFCSGIMYDTLIFYYSNISLHLGAFFGQFVLYPSHYGGKNVSKEEFKIAT